MLQDFGLFALWVKSSTTLGSLSQKLHNFGLFNLKAPRLGLFKPKAPQLWALYIKSSTTLGSLSHKLHDFGFFLSKAPRLSGVKHTEARIISSGSLPADWVKHRRVSDLKCPACGQKRQTKAYICGENNNQTDKTKNTKTYINNI